MPLDVDVDWTVRERVFARNRQSLRAPKQCAHTGHQLVRAERLREIVVGTKLEARYALCLLRARGDHDDGHGRGLAVRANYAADLETVDVRQHEIQYQEIGPPL